MSFKKDNIAIEKLLTEGGYGKTGYGKPTGFGFGGIKVRPTIGAGFGGIQIQDDDTPDRSGGHNGPTDGYAETISKIRNLQQTTMTVYEFVDNQAKNNKNPHYSQAFPDILETLQNVSLELGKYAGSYTTDEY